MTKYADKIKRLGFSSPKEYRDFRAKENGYKDYNVYRKQWRLRKKNDDGYRGYP